MPPSDDTAARLRELGCPYQADDHRAVPWLHGYEAGFTAASENAIKTLDMLMPGSKKS